MSNLETVINELLAQWKTSLAEARAAEKRAYSTWETTDWIEFRGENNSLQTRILDLEEALAKAKEAK